MNTKKLSIKPNKIHIAIGFDGKAICKEMVPNKNRNTVEKIFIPPIPK